MSRIINEYPAASDDESSLPSFQEVFNNISNPMKRNVESDISSKEKRLRCSLPNMPEETRLKEEIPDDGQVDEVPRPAPAQQTSSVRGQPDVVG